jgi:molybdenum cofactor cytidylyltransferase
VRDPIRQPLALAPAALAAALGLSWGDVVSFIGAGGKTSAAMRLMDELARAGGQAVFTTTTKIMEPIPRPGERLILARTLDAAYAALAKAGPAKTFLARLRLKESDPGFAARAPYPVRPNKLAGLPPEWVDALAARAADTTRPTFLVEADGSRHRLLKAPASHEPVVPTATTAFMPLADLAVLDKPLTDEFVHRAERVERLLSAPRGAPVTPPMVVRLLAHPAGGLKGAPQTARLLPMLTWWREEPPSAAALETADHLAAQRGIERVVVARPSAEEPVLYATEPTPVAAIVLAAGASQRMGQPKQLLPWGHNDQPMLRHVVHRVLAAPLDEVIVVLGHAADRIAPVLGGLPVRIVVNEDWAGGLSSSVRAGLDAIHPAAEAALFVPADQPCLTPGGIAALVARFRRTRAPIVVPVAGGRRGTPVLFARALFKELCAVRGDRGGRDLIARYPRLTETVELSDPTLLADIDTPGDYAALRPARSNPSAAHARGKTCTANARGK